jgi:hypothetical protein
MLAVLLLVSACGGGDGAEADETEVEKAPAHEFASRPDLTPALIEVTQDGGPVDGLYALGTKGDASPHIGPLLVDAAGEPVWIEHAEQAAFDVRVQEYEGEPVLTWWQGEQLVGLGFGEMVIVDQSYEHVATVTTGGDLGPGQADIHEARLTDEGTALLPAYVKVRADLSPVGGPEDGWLWDGAIQEVDVATGEVLFEWRALDHVPLEATVSEFDPEPEEEGDPEPGSEDAPFDYFHINSIAEDDDGDLLVSARNTSAVYKLDRETGEVLWTLGGEESDFEMGEGTTFWWQHDAERQPDGTLTIYDNQSEPDKAEQSRGIRLDLDEPAMTATLVTEYLPPESDSDRLSGSQGSFQQLDDGSVVIGWGSRPFYSHFAEDGTLLMDAFLGGGDNYRTYWVEWEGTPTDPPDAVREDGAVHVSWNGATEVAAWRLVTGESEDDAVAGQAVERDGFETTLTVEGDPAYVAVEALDADGSVIGAVEVG